MDVWKAQINKQLRINSGGVPFLHLSGGAPLCRYWASKESRQIDEGSLWAASWHTQSATTAECMCSPLICFLPQITKVRTGAFLSSFCLGTHSELWARGSPGICQWARPGVSYTAWQLVWNCWRTWASCWQSQEVEDVGRSIGVQWEFLFSVLFSFIITTLCPLHTHMSCTDTRLNLTTFSLFLVGWHLSPRQMPRHFSCQLADSVTLLQVG